MVKLLITVHTVLIIKMQVLLMRVDLLEVIKSFLIFVKFKVFIYFPYGSMVH